MSKHDLQKYARECASEVHTILSFHDTIGEGIAKLHRSNISDKIVYFYVVDNEHRLRGVIPVRKLLLTDPKTPISEAMQKETVYIHEFDTLGQALELFEKHQLLALPVIDDHGCLLGAIDVEMYVDEPIDVASSMHQREIFQFIGFTLEEGKKISLWQNYSLRMPWLFCNMLSGIICAIISNFNEKVLAKFLLLAFFIPLVLTLSESVSMQSMTQSIQFLRSPRFSWGHAFKKIIMEWKIVSYISVSCGVVIGTLSLFWGEGVLPSLTIGIGIIISVIFSALFGITIPILLHRTKLDPKIASGPVVLMIADILTTLFYLSFATWWLL